MVDVILFLMIGLCGFFLVIMLFVGAIYWASPRYRCQIKTGHANSDALGSVMYEDGPRFAYECRDCGALWTKPWKD